jgi:RimJ/RimL family protein N-acetyltransferase
MFLTTERLILRDFVPDDWPAVLAYQQDPRYLRHYNWTERTPDEVRAFVQMFLDQRFRCRFPAVPSDYFMPTDVLRRSAKWGRCKPHIIAMRR